MLQEVKAMASTVEARQNEQSSEGGDVNPGDEDGLGVTHLLAFVVGKLVT